MKVIDYTFTNYTKIENICYSLELAIPYGTLANN